MQSPRPLHREQRHAPVVLSAGAVEVVFEWAADRWTHRIRLDGEWMWESVDAPWPPGGDPRWPASPVLVELDRVGGGPAAAVVGVGLAGRSHFSASVSCVPAASFDGGRASRPDVLFEIACRAHEPPLWLGSSYAPLHPTAAQRLPLIAVSGCRRCDPGNSSSPGGLHAEPHRLRAILSSGSSGAREPVGSVTIGWTYRIARGDAAGAADAGPK